MPIENAVVAGKSGAGKQPRIDVLVQAFGLRQLSTGNLFREFIAAFKSARTRLGDGHPILDDPTASDAALRDALAAAGDDLDATVLGCRAVHYVDRGLFVPDTITNEIFATAFRRACGRGLALDGYPRSPDQSEFLLRLLGRTGARIDLVLVVDIDDATVLRRTTGRRICAHPACGKVFHVEYRPPTADSRCTVCGAPVIQRSDDTEEKVRRRLGEFEAKARPALQRLCAAGIPCVQVPGNLPRLDDESIRESVLSAIEPVLARAR